MDSLTLCQDLLLEVIVIDNASQDHSSEIAESYPFVQLVRNQENRGFPAACNQGIEQAQGEVLLFLNSDTIVPRVSLIRLLETLTQSGSIGAAGPYSNYSGHLQQITPTYTSLNTLNLFAEDFARREADDVETDMLVGFCLAVKCSVLQEVGAFDERFGTGMFEDNDLCYRIRRAGYRLMIAARSFVHHHGSRTFELTQQDPRPLLERNHALYVKKWQEDLESGFASHLSGLSPERIVFNPAKHPAIRRKQMQELARQANISLCMIVRNEERVLVDALNSAKPFFTEMIVVDTGSEDRTKEIVCEIGATLYEFPWTDSFAEARNESLRHAAGKWIFWMDADDVLPWASGEMIVQAAINAPPHVIGFVIPVQFVEQGQWGTRVDHVKLFRNFPGVQFEGRIHEQVLPSLNAKGGRIERLDAIVLHVNYDNSVEGQERKRERDFKLLELDLAERPDQPFVLFNLGMTYHYTGQHEQAVDWLRRCLLLSSPNESFLRKAYVMLAVSLRELGQLDECLHTFEQGFALFPDDPELNFQRGCTLEALQRYTEAKFCFRQVISADTSGYYSSVDIGLMGFKSYYHLGVICHAEGSYLEAREWWLKSIADAPQFPAGHLSLFEAALQVGDFATARQMLEHLRRLEGVSEEWIRWGMEYAYQVGGTSNVETFLYGLVQENTRSIAARLMLARYLLQSERWQEAYPHLLDLTALGVAEAAFHLGVYAIRLGDFRQALQWMERASELNPEHEGTLEQIAHLKFALESESREQGVRS
jgi:GT2 family glycosyltransferase/tetratricopeptide (TPR) repeat protein